MKCLHTGMLIYLIVTIVFIFEIQAIDVATTIPPKLNGILRNTNISNVKYLLNKTRRIMIGSEATTNRPYMVYLKLPVNNPKYQDYRRWLCGGVIIAEEYILTSAACIEDARHFYVVSGTYKHDEREDRYNNLCIKNGAKKAVWKCIPRNYIFDGHENDNIRWMNNDIAVVKVEDEFDFTRRIRGCDFVPRPICYNNQSQRLEEPDNWAVVAGWGSTLTYNDETPTQNLLESKVKLIGKQRCKKRWGKRYHNIIDNYMICTKDIVTDMSEICQEKYVDCTDIMYSAESDETARRVLIPKNLVLHSTHQNVSLRGQRRAQKPSSGGFCENDHGGPLIYGAGANEVVIGIISACLVKERTNQCYGPFLYTSVFKNKNLISCAIYKDVATDCDKLFRSSITHTEVNMSWADHPDGPAKSETNEETKEEIEEEKEKEEGIEIEEKEEDKEKEEVKVKEEAVEKELMRRQNTAKNSSRLTTNDSNAIDIAAQHKGVIVRIFKNNTRFVNDNTTSTPQN